MTESDMEDPTGTTPKERVSGESETRRGEEMPGAEGTESGRRDVGKTGADRPAGQTDARYTTGIDPESKNPIDPESPNMPVEGGGP